MHSTTGRAAPVLHIEHFGDLAGATSGATVDIQIDNVARLAAKGSADEAALVGRFALSGLGIGTLPQYDRHGDAAKMVDFLQRAELFESEQIRSLKQALAHCWELVPDSRKLALSDELAQLPASTYRDIASATLIEHYLESCTLSSLTSEKIVSLFDSVPSSDQIDTLFAEGLEKLRASGNKAKAIEVFNSAYPNPTTPWERMLSKGLSAPR
ncbi:MAG: hypothetical protein KDN22_06780 [Verrucomicrobiae bacterium]|nr:hypothetical protein [Verrucomicrobiae bacterium]